MASSVERVGNRFSKVVDGHTAHVDFELTEGTMVITHTSVPTEVGGRGIAADLVQAAFDHARKEGLKVSPVCSYAAVWLQKHPDYADLLR